MVIKGNPQNQCFTRIGYQRAQKAGAQQVSARPKNGRTARTSCPTRVRGAPAINNKVSARPQNGRTASIKQAYEINGRGWHIKTMKKRKVGFKR